MATAGVSSPALAATPDDILAANKAAMGDWQDKATLKANYTYSGQGLTGMSSSLEDLQRGAYVDSYDIPPQKGATGFDGAKAWEKEPSGTITDQAGGDVIPLAITEVYLNRHLWWRADYGGATIRSLGQKIDRGITYDALKITPEGGTRVEAWFDPRTHLLYRTIEDQELQVITTIFSDYAPVDGAMIAKTYVVDDGSHNLRSYTLASAKFSDGLPIRAYYRPAEDLHDFSIAGGAHETTVPFHLWNNHVYADVSVNGSKPMIFIFDTGGHSILLPSTAKALGLEARGAVSATGGGDNIASDGEATVKSIAVGGATITDQPVVTLEFSPPGTEGVGEKGMLGYEFFARFITRFDYGAHTVTFIDKRYFDPTTAGTPVPMRLYHQFPEIVGSYNGTPGRFGIDTGARTPLILNKAWAARNGVPAPGVQTLAAQTGWGVGGPTQTLVFKGGVLKLGSVTIEHPLTMVSTDKRGSHAGEAFPSNVGGGVLKRFVVTFDYDKSTMYLKPIPGPIDDLDTFDKSGMWINAAAEGYKVISISKGGPAEAAGLQANDLITAVNGQRATNIPLYDIRKRLRDEAAGTVIRLTVGRSGQIRTVSLTLRDLI